MRRLVLALTALATLGLAVAAPAGAITNGSPDGNAHPNVGGLVADQAYSDGTWIYCSGTLISPTCSSPRRTVTRAAPDGCG